MTNPGETKSGVSRSLDVMKRKAESENARARTQVRNQVVSSAPTPRFAHTGERDWGNPIHGRRSPTELRSI
jgi:hypothetical protein